MTEKKGGGVPLLILVLISLVVMSPTILYPFGRDQGIFGYAGRMILRGGVPFRDFWDPKPPALYYFYAAAEFLFGHSMSSVRILDLLWQVGAAVAIFFITRSLSAGRLTAAIAGLLYIFAYASRGWWNTAQPDDFLNLPAAVSMALIMRAIAKGPKLSLSFAAGILIGIVFYLKYPMGAMLLVCIAGLFVSGGSPAGRAANIFAISGGFFILTAGYAIYLYWQGAWGEFYYASIIWPRGYMRVGEGSGGIWGAPGVREILNSHFSFIWLAILSVVAYIRAIARRKCDPRFHLIALWAAVALLSLYLPRKFYLYHYAPLLPPLAIGAAFTLAFALDMRRSPAIRGAVAILIIIALIAPLYGVNGRYNFYCLRTYAESARAVGGKLFFGRPLDGYYMNARFTSDDFSLPADIVVADYIRRKTRDGEPLFIWGYETIVYYLAGRDCVSRFIHNFPLRCNWVPERFGEELFEKLSRERPKYILVLKSDPAWWATGNMDDSLNSIKRYPRMERLLAENYSFEGSIEDFLIFRLKNGSA